MRRFTSVLFTGLVLLCLAACASASETRVSAAENTSPVYEYSTVQAELDLEKTEDEVIMEQNTFYITIEETTFTATFADNPGAEALKKLLEKETLVISMRDYGGFEKVGSLGQSLPASNRQTRAQAGDIVLYQGDQIVMFYGSNSWSYTRLGKVNGLDGWDEALGRGDILAEFSLTDPQN